MSNRIQLLQEQPEALKAMLALDNYLNTTELSKLHKELIKIRASQINGCSYCINKHTIDARKLGETEQRIYALSVWRDTPFFDEKERAILALTEEVTLIANHVSDETYHNAAAALGETYLAQVIMAIITINAWNRIGITIKMEPAILG